MLSDTLAFLVLHEILFNCLLLFSIANDYEMTIK